MNKYFVGVLCLSMIFIAGCVGGQRVVNNQYNSMGYPSYTVSSDFKHIGSPELYSYNTTSELFVRDANGVVVEAVEIRREWAQKGYYVKSVRGPRVLFGEKDYAEFFFVIEEQNEVADLVNHIKERGYTFDGKPMVGCMLMRKANHTNVITLSYACSEVLLPPEATESEKGLHEYLRGKFLEVVTLPDQSVE